MSGFRITAAKPSATGLPCIRPCCFRRSRNGSFSTFPWSNVSAREGVITYMVSSKRGLSHLCIGVCVCVCAVFIQYGVPACLLSCSNVAWRACVVIFSSEQRVSCQRIIVTLLFVRFFTRLLRMITPFDVAEIWLVFDSLF